MTKLDPETYPLVFEDFFLLSPYMIELENFKAKKCLGWSYQQEWFNTNCAIEYNKSAICNERATLRICSSKRHYTKHHRNLLLIDEEEKFKFLFQKNKKEFQSQTMVLIQVFY